MLGSARLAAVRARLAQLPWAAARERFVQLPWPELGAATALVAGWTLLSWAIASLTRTWQVWPISAGLFLLSLFGWRYLFVMARDGLYTLTREPRR